MAEEKNRALSQSNREDVPGVFGHPIQYQLELVQSWPGVLDIFYSSDLGANFVIFSNPPSVALASDILIEISSLVDQGSEAVLITNVLEVAPDFDYLVNVFPGVDNYQELHSVNPGLQILLVGADPEQCYPRFQCNNDLSWFSYSVFKVPTLEDATEFVQSQRTLMEIEGVARRRAIFLHRHAHLLDGNLAGALLEVKLVPDKSVLCCDLSGGAQLLSLENLAQRFSQLGIAGKYTDYVVDSRNLGPMASQALGSYMQALKEVQAANQHNPAGTPVRLAILSAMEPENNAFRDAVTSYIRDLGVEIGYFASPSALWRHFD